MHSENNTEVSPGLVYVSVIKQIMQLNKQNRVAIEIPR